ncbi:MAG: heparinase II/III-family protein [Rhodothermaceae bacterium]|nr:heparinase II/III-family protein [Rhodothermaceae bacterium]
MQLGMGVIGGAVWGWDAGVRDEQWVGLFLDDERLGEVRDRFLKGDFFAEYRASLDAFDVEGTYRFIEDELVFNDHLFHIRRLTDVASERAFYYLMTGHEASAQLAITAIEAIMNFDRWDYFLDGDHPIGFQRASRATTAVSLCVDWLADLITEAQRDRWIRTMGERGCEPCYRAIWGMRYPEQVDGWAIDPSSTYFEHRPGDRSWDLSNWPYIFDKNNLKAEPAAALTIGAIAYERHIGSNPDTERWIEQAIHSISGYREIFEQDGSYNEGISYAGATALHLMQAYSILYRFRDLDLSDQLNWSGFMDYALNLTLPTREDPASVINFGDVGTGLPSSVPHWIATHTHDPYASWLASNRDASTDFWSVLWAPQQEDHPSASPPAGPVLWRSDLEWIVSRTGYSVEDLVVAMRSGPPFNHEHADRNSIILACYGEKLVVDPHRPGYSRTDPTWMMRGTVGHSGILIDGQGHQYVDGSEGTNASEATARLVRFGERSGYHFWSSDATHAYQLVLPDVALVMRTVLVLYEEPAVVLIDKVVKTETPSSVQARFFAYNNDQQGRIQAIEEGLHITRPHAHLFIHSYCAGGIQPTSTLLPLPEEIAMKYPYGEVSTQQAGTHVFLITVLSPVTADQPAPAVSIRGVDEGRYEVSLRAQKRVWIEDAGDIPEIGVWQ